MKYYVEVAAPTGRDRILLPDAQAVGVVVGGKDIALQGERGGAPIKAYANFGRLVVHPECSNVIGLNLEGHGEPFEILSPTPGVEARSRLRIAHRLALRMAAAASESKASWLRAMETSYLSELVAVTSQRPSEASEQEG